MHFVKRDPSAPDGFFEVEAAGLRWLGEVPDGAPAVRVLGVRPDGITLERLQSASPSRDAAELFGRGLAGTHAAGAGWFGAPPDGWDGDGFIGPMPLPHATKERPASFGDFYARYRLEPYLRRARDAGTLDSDEAATVATVVDRIATGDLDAGHARPSRIHGDLWSGNVIWTPSGAILIDPAAHGGHPETDLAMLDLFGLPHLDRVVAAYQEVGPLADGRHERIALHQLHPLLVHVVLFGGGYVGRLLAAARRYL
ncbi:MAG TPA: fructosamine kinase family protein [Actinomycetales bacterium]|nr:fructosamine kinase family protein [Actinomycetales bacterium]